MDIAVPISEATTHISVKENNTAPTQCPFTDCQPDHVFPTTALLEKHIEKKHTKPYLCTVPNCKHPRFGDKAGLDRHKREVHSSQSFPCPITSCKRHIKPFHRQYNVFDHLKRCHPQTSRTRATLLPRPTSMNYRESEEGSEDTAEPMSPNSVLSGVTIDKRSRNQRVQEKLEMLRAMRAEIEADIQAIERAEEILESS